MDYYNFFVNRILNELTTSDVGIGSTGDNNYSSDEIYAPGDVRMPKVLGSVISRRGKLKRKRKKK